MKIPSSKAQRPGCIARITQGRRKQRRVKYQYRAVRRKEHPDWTNGAFTKALVEGLNGAAATEHGSITWKSLDNYITRRVKELTNGEQSAVTAVPPDTEDFPIGVK